MTSQIDTTSLRKKLAKYGQDHTLQFWDELTSGQQASLHDQLSKIDLDELAALIDGQDSKQDFAAMAVSADSPPSVRADGGGAAWSLDDARRRGVEALKAGEVGAVIVAGGQGTRLGFDHPKGMFPVGPVSQRTLFQVFADRLAAIKSMAYEFRFTS